MILFRTRTLLAATLSLAVSTIAAHPAAARSYHEHHHSRHYQEVVAAHRSTTGRVFPSMASRGVTETRLPDGQYVVGRLGVVTDDDVPIIAGREQYGRLLSKCPKGTSLTITGETDDYYAVMMIDKSIGFVAKDKVSLLNYQITSTEPLNPGGVAAGPLGQQLIQNAVTYLGVPYIYGGTTENGIDCSAFVKAVYSQSGMTLPRTAAEQANVGYQVPIADPSQWQVGDRMYFQCHHDYIDHAGMYIGNGYFIHSSIGNGGVGVTRIDSPYYWAHLVAVRRSPEMMADAPKQAVTTADTETSQQ